MSVQCRTSGQGESSSSNSTIANQDSEQATEQEPAIEEELEEEREGPIIFLCYTFP